jgi:hypothetical protein
MGTQMYVQKDTKNDHGVVPALRGFGMASPAEQSMVLHDQIYCSTTCTCRDAFLQREGGGGAHHRNFMALFRNRSAVRMLGGGERKQCCSEGFILEHPTPIHTLSYLVTVKSPSLSHRIMRL